MFPRLGLVVGIIVWTAVAHAETFYKYRDPQSGRDVFVNRLDQIPRAHRNRAKIVMEAVAPPAKPESDLADAPMAAPLAETPTSSAAPEKLRTAKQSVRALFAGKNVLKEAPVIAAEMVNRRLAQAGQRPLDDGERLQLGRLLGTVVGLALAASLAAFVVWLVMLVGAFRDRRFGWAIAMLLVGPAAYLYLFIHGGRGLVFKLACSAALVSPGLVGIVAASWFSRWFHAVVQARGGRL